MNLNKKIAILILALAPVMTFAAANETGKSETIPTARPVESKSEYQPHMGLLLGVADINNDYNNAAEYGLDFGYQPYVPFGLGAEVTYFKSDSSVGGPDLERTQVIAKGSYNFGGTTPIIRHSYIGLGVGAAIDESETKLVSVPMIGFDIPVARESGEEKNFSLGAQLRHSLVEGSAPDSTALNGTMKYWF